MRAYIAPLCLLLLPAVVILAGNPDIPPTTGAHALASYHLGGNDALEISTPPVDTRASGSTMLVCIGRGKISEFKEPPSDSHGNKTCIQLGAKHPYTGYPDSGTALYAMTSATGGRGHIITAKTAARDEVTVAAVEIRNGGKIQDVQWNEVLRGHPLTSLSVTTTGPATLVAFWWGDGDQYFGHTAKPGDGFTLVDSLLPSGCLVQTAVATKDVATAGTYSITWNSAGREGAQLWIVAMQTASAPR